MSVFQATGPRDAPERAAPGRAVPERAAPDSGTAAMGTAEFLRDPYPVYAAMRRDDPVHRDARGIWYLTRHADIAAALGDLRLSNDRDRMTAAFAALDDRMRAFSRLTERLGRVMTNTDPPDHARLRKLVNKAFTARRVEALRGRVQQIVDDLLDTAVAAGPGTDLIGALASPLPTTVICELFGIPDADRARVGEWFRALSRLGTDLAHAEAVVVRFEDYLSRLISERRKTPGGDIISALVAAQARGDRLSDEELLSTCYMLVTAGDETTTHLIGNGLLALLRNPDQLHRLREDPSLARPAIDELVRYDTPTQVILRVAAEDIPLDGHTVPAGALVYLVLGSANRDPERFPDPDRLDLTRPEAAGNGHLAFGHGPHFCLGAPLARLQAEIAIGTAVRRLPGLHLDGTVSDLRWQANPLQRRLSSLPVVF